MSRGLIGIERDLIIKTLVQDKSSLRLRAEVSTGDFSTTLTLQKNDYIIYAQGIIFFKKFLPEWNNVSKPPRLRISFYHKGRGLYFIEAVKRVSSGYAVVFPTEIYMLDMKLDNYQDKLTAKISYENYSQTLYTGLEHPDFPLFDPKLWQYFSKKELEKAKTLLYSFGYLKEVTSPFYCNRIMKKLKTILYVPGKKIPMRNFFPYPVTITQESIDENEILLVEDELSYTDTDVFFPLCETPLEDVHSIVGLYSQKKLINPLDILETSYVFPICKYLVQNSSEVLHSDLRNEPFSILFISDSNIIFGIKTQNTSSLSFKKNVLQKCPLQKDQEYAISLSIPIKKIPRTIFAHIYVNKICMNNEGSYAVVCNFKSVKEEDKRLLYELYTKRKYNL